MKRYHLSELHELKSFPLAWRDFVTDFLSFFARFFKPYSPVANRLKKAVSEAGATRIIDLCSGAAQPILTIKEELDHVQMAIPIIISDKYPHKKAFNIIEKENNGEVIPVYSSVDATDVPPELDGFRTFFTAFHHFKKNEAQKIIADAVQKKQGIAVFEYTERSLAWAIYSLNIPWVVLASSLFIKPLSWQRILITYLIPVIPLCVCIDGAISCLRTYSPRELQDLVQKVEQEVDAAEYIWEIGQVRSMYIMRVTYLIGYPVR